MPEPTVPDPTDTPAVALGPTALVLGAISVIGTWVPALAFVMFPWAIIAGALAVTLGTAGIHYACHDTGRLWTAIAGTTLGIIGFVGTMTLIWALSA
ncbi:hypothetical protein GCM10010207_45750 [Streptomyces atratus]|uniref:hypothetical protein n=1 Tax=Streptomyces atratus TaxID=1893 RepID=UPI0016700A9A|nr:hypothetical protein [Streptomyces atratus]GGT40580.1 hypothetical protein GCM10010207_45750 [Streptomyces atratus]